jgi:hypothetical protein
MISEYYPEHEARVLSKGPGKHTWYTRPGTDFKKYNVKDKRQINAALEWSEVVHCMANVSARSFKRMDLIDKRVWVFQWHGAQIWPFERVWLPEDFSKVKWIHIGQGWERDPWFDQFDAHGFKIVPNVISIEDELHRPIGFEARKPVVSFAPSNNKHNAVNRKGIPEVQRACKIAFSLDMITGTPFEHCLKRKRRSMLGIDEVVTPLYHRSGLEYLSQGTPCICSSDEFTRTSLKAATGADRFPFIDAKPGNLAEVIRGFMITPADERKAMSAEARNWMKTYYHPRDLLKRYLDVYNAG